MKIFSVLFVVFIVMSCSNQIIDKENSELYNIPLGSVFVLHQPLDVLPFQTRAFIQAGRQLNKEKVDEYYPYCEIEVKDIKSQLQVIQPNRFKLLRIVDDEYEAQRHIIKGMQPVGDGPLFLGFASEYYVQPEQPSDVVKITCLQWGDVYEEHYLTLREIRQALGEMLTLILKPIFI